MATHEGLHEDGTLLNPETVDRHRALASLGEELEAIDWYDQRIDAAQDPDLKEILAHNRDEEKEHAAMVLEWLRRHDAKIDDVLREYLFKEGSIVAQEVEATGGQGERGTGGATAVSDGSLGIGSLRSAAKV